MEVFGYTGDTAWAMKTLSKAGQWSADPKQVKPGMPVKDEGVRRQICDMSMLAYHLVISTFIPVNGVDIDFADKVLHYNLPPLPGGRLLPLLLRPSLLDPGVGPRRPSPSLRRRATSRRSTCSSSTSASGTSRCATCRSQSGRRRTTEFAILAAENNWSKAVVQLRPAPATCTSLRRGEDQRRDEGGG
ncbi:hypothetical protein L1887_42093 [Cichorium endivia]|nr:hypothetical protein L1887_42093 [Cichorium endivia]